MDCGACASNYSGNYHDDLPGTEYSAGFEGFPKPEYRPLASTQNLPQKYSFFKERLASRNPWDYENPWDYFEEKGFAGDYGMLETILPKAAPIRYRNQPKTEFDVEIARYEDEFSGLMGMTFFQGGINDKKKILVFPKTILRSLLSTQYLPPGSGDAMGAVKWSHEGNPHDAYRSAPPSWDQETSVRLTTLVGAVS